MNGKGDADRTTDRDAYREGYDAIDWHRKPEFYATFVHAPKPIKPDDTCYICHQPHADT